MSVLSKLRSPHPISLLSIALVSSLLASGQTAGPNSSATGTNEVVSGSNGAWTNTGNGGASDNTYIISTSLPSAGSFSDRMVFTNFGFSIPAGNSIQGITVSVERSVTGGSNINDLEVFLVKGGITQTATNKAAATTWPTTDNIANYGGAADLWGNTWSIADINASGFGVAIAAQRFSATGAPQNARIDHVTVTVSFAGVLPVDFGELTGRYHSFDKSVALKWQVFNESQVAHYSVERSASGVRFESIGNLQASASSAGTNDYHFTDPGPLPGINYYRVISHDRDGAKKSSRVVQIRTTERNPFLTASTTPRGQKIQLISGNQVEPDQPVSITLIDPSGRALLKKQLYFSGAGSIQEIDLPAGAPKGILYLTWTQQSRTDVIPLLIE